MIEYRKTEDSEAILKIVNTSQLIPNSKPLTVVQGVMFGAFDGDELVGVGGYVVKGHNANTTYLTVRSDYRGQGIGEELHKLRVADAKVAGCYHITTITKSTRVLKWYLTHSDYQIVRVGKGNKLRTTFIGDSELEPSQMKSKYGYKKSGK